MLPDCSRRGGNYDDKRDENQKAFGENSSVGARMQAIFLFAERRKKGICLGGECDFSRTDVQIRIG